MLSYITAVEYMFFENSVRSIAADLLYILGYEVDDEFDSYYSTKSFFGHCLPL